VESPPANVEFPAALSIEDLPPPATSRSPRLHGALRSQDVSRWSRPRTRSWRKRQEAPASLPSVQPWLQRRVSAGPRCRSTARRSGQGAVVEPPVGCARVPARRCRRAQFRAQNGGVHAATGPNCLDQPCQPGIERDRFVSTRNRRSDAQNPWPRQRFRESGRRDSNPRPSPWQGGGARPLSWSQCSHVRCCPPLVHPIGPDSLL